MSLDTNFVRQQFPGLAGDWTFFDNAGGSQILKPVIDKIGEYLVNNNVQTGGSYDVSLRSANAVLKGREAIATWVNAARPQEVVLGPSTTVLLQNLSRSLSSQWQEGDEIIVTNSDHESNIGPWINLENKGVVTKFWEINADTYELDLDQLKALMSEKTKLVCFTHASNILGTINPVKEITRLAHEHGAKVCVDAVAYAPHRAIDVLDWDVDYYAFSLYKTYGPHHAALYGKYDHLLKLDNLYHYFYQADQVPGKLEPGNTNYELTYGSTAIVDYLSELGIQAGSSGSTRDNIVAAFSSITTHENKLGERLLGYLRSREDCRIIGLTEGDDPRRVPTISFIIDGKDPEQVCKKMDLHKIAMRFGDFHSRRLVEALGLAGNKGVLRVSMTHYNTIEEVDALIKALELVLDD